MKKRVIAFLSCIVAGVLSSAQSVYAHNGDVFKGSYVLDRQKNLKLRISMSAQTSLMNREVYESALKWNDISSNVHITVIMETPGMPSIADTMGVYDGRGGNLNGPDLLKTMGYYGLTQFFDSNGNQVSHDEKCDHARILINVNHPDYSRTGDPVIAASMNFTHEVGHVLMLSHPVKGSAGHSFWNSLPYAVMNQGLPQKNKEVSYLPTDHDKSCLIAKWGV